MPTSRSTSNRHWSAGPADRPPVPVAPGAGEHMLPAQPHDEAEALGF